METTMTEEIERAVQAEVEYQLERGNRPGVKTGPHSYTWAAESDFGLNLDDVLSVTTYYTLCDDQLDTLRVEVVYAR